MDWDKYLSERQDGFDQAKQSLRNLAPSMLEKGVRLVVIKYDGSGDEGYVDEITFADVEGKSVQLENDKKMKEELDEIAYVLLPEGWENDEGGYGEVRFEPETAKIRRIHNQRYLDVQTEDEEL